MGSRVTRHRLALVATVVVAGSALSACGSTPAPTSTPTPGVATTSASPEPTATATPLSAFEDRAPVQAMRRWAVLLERSINHRNASLSSLAPVATPSGIRFFRQAYADDLAHGYRWPGPQPFTPTRVTISGKSASVSACVELGGWSVDRKTGKQVHKRSVSPAVFTLVRQGSSWKIDNAATGIFSCKHVKVREVR